MANFRISFGVIQRSKGGSALRRSAYQRCAKDVAFDFSNKARELVSSDVILPENSPEEFKNPAYLWSAAECAERRKDAQLGRTFEIMIPQEIPAPLRNDYAKEVLGFLVERGFAVEWSRHSVPIIFDASYAHKTGDEKTEDMNDHIHALVSLRQIDADGFCKKKDEEFSCMMRKNGGRDMRQLFADKTNEFMMKNGIDDSVSVRRINKDEKIPCADKHTIKLIKKHKIAYDKAVAGGLTTPDLHSIAAEFIEYRSNIIEAINEVRAAELEVKKLEKEIESENLDVIIQQKTTDFAAIIREARETAAIERDAGAAQKNLERSRADSSENSRNTGDSDANKQLDSSSDRPNWSAGGREIRPGSIRRSAAVAGSGSDKYANTTRQHVERNNRSKTSTFENITRIVNLKKVNKAAMSVMYMISEARDFILNTEKKDSVKLDVGDDFVTKFAAKIKSRIEENKIAIRNQKLVFDEVFTLKM